MRSSWSILAVAAVLAVPAAASAQSADLFSEFRQACVHANADPDVVRTAAKGWRLTKAPKGYDQAKAWSRDGYTLVSGVQKLNRGERRTCSLSGPADRQAEARAAAWAGGRASSGGPVSTYLLLDAAKAPRPATTADARDPNKVGRVSGLAVSTAGEVTTLGYSTFATSPSYFGGNQGPFLEDLPYKTIQAHEFLQPPKR
jgi:hypothetical protein